MIRPLRTPLRSLLATLALTLALPACAQTSAAPPAPARDADPALWVVRDADTTVYLFGTIHVLKPGLSWFDEAVKTAFDRSGQVMLEMVEPDTATMQRIVMASGMIPPTSPPLTQMIPPAKRAAYTQAVTGLGLSPATLDRYRPWLAAVTLSLLPLVKAGYDPANGPEGVITAAAKAAGKPVAGLETAEQQIGYFAELSDKAQVDFLTETVAELPKASAELDEMVADWSRGDPAALAAVMNDDLKASPEVANVLLYSRNARWADWIKGRMATPGTVFIAVGAGHLAGDRSVIADLEAKGVKVERVKY
jgi:uncharacterized protein YbaP (TraB family)